MASHCPSQLPSSHHLRPRWCVLPSLCLSSLLKPSPACISTAFVHGCVSTLNKRKVFAAWCLRPEGFFPRLYKDLRLLKMEDGQLKDEMSKARERWFRENGIRTASEAGKIVKNRVFVG